MDYLLCPFQPPVRADNGGCAILPAGWTHPKHKLDLKRHNIRKKRQCFDNGREKDIRDHTQQEIKS